MARGHKSHFKAPVVPQNLFYAVSTNFPTMMELAKEPALRREVGSPNKLFPNTVMASKGMLCRRATTLDSEEVAMSLMLLAEMLA